MTSPLPPVESVGVSSRTTRSFAGWAIPRIQASIKLTVEVPNTSRGPPVHLAATNTADVDSAPSPVARSIPVLHGYSKITVPQTGWAIPWPGRWNAAGVGEGVLSTWSDRGVFRGHSFHLRLLARPDLIWR